MKTEKFLNKYTHSLSGKRVAITGSTGGLGVELCRLLAKNGAEIVLVDRNPKKQQNLVEDLKKDFPNLNLQCLTADMEDISSVLSAADKLAENPLDVLILNAGAYNIPRHKTDLGWDNVFQINFLSPYCLARKLLPHLKKCHGRVVAVASIAQGYSKTDPDDVDFSTRKRACKVYGNAKRYLVNALFDLARQGEPVTVVHPGVSPTGITAHYAKWINALIKHPMNWIFMPPKKACLCIYYGIFCTPQPYFWIGPRHCNIWGLPKIRKVKGAKVAEQKRIAQQAEQLYLQLNN